MGMCKPSGGKMSQTGRIGSLKKEGMPNTRIDLFNENGEVLLLKRKKTGFGDSKYGFIGGHVEKGENVKKAIIREVNE